MVTTSERIQLNRKTAAQWTAANPVLLPGEAGIELDTGKAKFGNATGTAWNALPYSSSNAVASVAGRTGAVTLTAADVGLGNVTNTSDANKPVSTAQAAALAAKADFPAGGVNGQLLSRNGTTTAWLTPTFTASAAAPATATAAGTPGQVAYDSGFVYVCVAANSWRRSALTAW